jgi:hypothetical protein
MGNHRTLTDMLGIGKDHLKVLFKYVPDGLSNKLRSIPWQHAGPRSSLATPPAQGDLALEQPN